MDQGFKVLVFHHHICHAPFQLLYQPKQLSDVEGLGCKGLSAAGVAAAEQLEEHGGTAHIIVLGKPDAQFLQFVRFQGRQHDFRQLQLLDQVGIVELLIVKKSADGIKVITGIERTEAEFADGCHRPCFHAAEQISQIPVEIVIHFESVDLGFPKQDTAGAAKHINESAVLQWKQCVKDVENGCFIANS